MRTVVIAGASGLVGQAAVERFLAGGWRVVAVSRRPPDVAASADRLIHLPLDLRNADACRDALASVPAASHLVHAAVSEQPGLVAGWSDAAQMRENLAMLDHLLRPMLDGGALKHVSILQGGKAYGAHLHAVPVPAREEWPRDPHENFYWLHEDAVRAAADSHGIGFTVFRPPVIVGGATGAAMNVVVPIAAYAALCRDSGEPFGFPGGLTNTFDLVDARVVADALLWAAEAPAAANQIFNVGNGEVADWRALWPDIADALGVEAAPDRPVRLAEYLPAQSECWAAIAAREGLREPDIGKLLGESHHYADILFAHGSTTPRPQLFLSTLKLRRAGFDGNRTGPETFRYWIADLIRRRLIPSPS